MRRQLEEARPGETFRDVLRRIGPPALARFLREGPGFSAQISAPNVKMERAESKRVRYHFTGTGLVADVAIEYSPELGVAVQTVTLTNEGAEPTPPIQALHAFYIPLEAMMKDSPRACWFGGGVPDSIYPPRAYREEEVCFGQAREWVAMSEERTVSPHWWLRSRSTTVASEVERGWSSIPYIPIIETGWNGDGGEVGLWAALEWSGRWEMHMGTQQDGRFVFRGGPRVRNIVLAPGETLRLPRAHIGTYGSPGATRAEGLNRIRRYVAEVVAPDVEGMRPWPFLAYDHWFGMEENISEAILRRQVDRAAELGLEYFVIDAGWYPMDNNRYYTGLGNWERVDTAKFPNGLEPVAEYVRSKGMRFGLWFEPERGRLGTDWVKAHPDWYWDSGGGVVFILNLTRRDAQDAMIEMLSRWITRLDIRWLRWDFSHAIGPYWDKIDPTGKVQFAYIEGLYRVRDELLKRHPNLMIDTCAGGGHRIDLGMLRSAGTMVISDHSADPHICRLMQTGGARILPGNYMNSSLYLGEEEGDSAVGALDVVSRMAGAITFSGHIANFSKRHTVRLRKHLEAYRTFRHLLMKDFYALTPYPRSPADWDVAEFIDPETSEAVLLAYRVRGEEKSRTVLLKHLDPAKTYEIADPFSGARPRRVSGKVLMERGLRLTLAPESAAVRHLRPAS